MTAALRDAPERFAELARAHSACPSKAVGGNLGQLSPGDTAPEFDAALRAMAPGEITTEPVASRFGHHIIRLDRRIEGRQLPFEQVQERIADYLVDRARHTAIAQFVARLTARARDHRSRSPYDRGSQGELGARYAAWIDHCQSLR